MVEFHSFAPEGRGRGMGASNYRTLPGGIDDTGTDGRSREQALPAWGII